MLYPTPVLTDEDQRVLTEVDAMRTHLRYQVQEKPMPWTEGLRKYLTTDAIAASNSIEGFRVSTVDATDIIAGETDVKVSAENRAETLAYHQLMTYVQTLHDVDDFSYSKGLLNAMHWMLQGHRHRTNKPAGQWRRGQVYVTDVSDPSTAAYTAPPVEEVPALMAELIDWLNTPDQTPVLVRAAMAHLHLVSIHPWADGNGRMSRTLQTLLITREGILAPEFSSIEVWLGRSSNTWRYYQVLESRGPHYQPDQDVSDWVRFNLTAYHQQAQSVLARVDTAATVWRMLAEWLPAGTPERVITALHEVATLGRLRRSGYERAEGISLQQAQRDLRELVATGVLAPLGRTRSRTYSPGPAFPADILEIATTPITLEQPYT